MTKFAPSPRPISSAMTRRDDVGVLLVGDVEAGVLRAGSAAVGSCSSASSRGMRVRAPTMRQRSGAPSSWHSNPRSRTWRNGTSASTSRGVPAASVSGMSASRSTSTTSPVSSSTVASSRAMRANGMPLAASSRAREGRSGSSPAFHRVGRSLKRERPPSGGLWSGNANTPPSAGGPPRGEVRGHAAERLPQRRGLRPRSADVTSPRRARAPAPVAPADGLVADDDHERRRRRRCRSATADRRARPTRRRRSARAARPTPRNSQMWNGSNCMTSSA